jgi:hypothetical protein
MALSVVAASIGVVPAAAAGFACTPTVRVEPGPPVWEGMELEFYATLEVQPGCPVEGTSQYHTEAPVSGGDFDATPGTSATTPLADYLARSAPITWTDGQATETIKVPTLKDNRHEPVEQVKLCVDQPKGSPPGIVCAIGVLRSTPMCVRNGSTAAFDINLAVAVREDVIVHYSTIDGTAKAGEDFVVVRDSQVKIPAGSLEARPKPSVQTLPNRPGEPVEYFDVEFTAVVSQVLQTGRIRVEIM